MTEGGLRRSTSRLGNAVADLSSCLLLLLVAGFGSLPLFSSAVPPGYDSVMHLSKISIFARFFPSIPDWFPWWYCGTPSLRFYPPASYLTATFAGWVSGITAVEAYRYAELATSFLAGLFVHLFVRALGCGRIAGLAAAVLYLLSPQTLHGRFFIGQYTHDFSMFLVPLILFSIVACGPNTRKAALVTAPWYALLLLTHLHTAVALGVMLGACVLIRLIATAAEREVEPLDVSGILLGGGIGGLLAGFWLLPSLLEASGRFDLPVESAVRAIIPIESLFVSADHLPYLAPVQAIWCKQYFLGVPLIALGVLAIVLLARRRFDRRTTFWGLAAASWVALFLFAIVSPHLGIVMGWPNRFPYFVAMPLALLAGLAVSWLERRVASGLGRRAALAGILRFGIFTLVLFAAWRQARDPERFTFHPYLDEIPASEWLARNLSDGERVAAFGTVAYVFNVVSDGWQLGGGYIQGQINPGFYDRYREGLTAAGDTGAVMRMLAATNCRAVVIPLEAEVPEAYRDESRFERTEIGGYGIYRLKDEFALNLVTVAEGEATARYEYVHPDEIEIEVEKLSERATLLVKMNHYPGWSVRSPRDGARLERSEDGLMEVEVSGPQPVMTVTLSYGPTGADFAGYGMTVAGIALSVFVVARGRRARPARPPLD